MKHSIPIFWRYILSQYLKVFFLCVVAFIAILMTTRLEDIVNFASLGPNGWYIFKYIFYQIPYILPISIPISCLISTILLMQRLSSTHELTAFRASGASLFHIIAPILIASTYLMAANFYIVSELATSSHLATNFLKAELRSVNPLHLVRNKHLLKMKGVYYDALGSSKIGETAEDVVMALPNFDKTRVNILVAKNLEATSEEFKGKGITFISCMSGLEEQDFDQLIVENVGSTDSMVGDFMDILHKQSWKTNNDHLYLSMLLAKIQGEAKLLREKFDPDIQREFNRSVTEVFRRISIAMAAFTFTLMGAAFGIQISRNRSNRGVFYVVSFAALYLACYFLALGIGHLRIAATLLYMAPQGIIILASLWMLKRISRGVE